MSRAVGTGSVLKFNADELKQYLSKVMPSSQGLDFRILDLAPEKLRVALPFKNDFLRPGELVSGPTQMMLADMTAYLLILAHIGPQAMAVTSNLNINFLQGLPAGDVVAEASFYRLGLTLAVVNVEMYPSSTPDQAKQLASQATVTYVIPRMKQKVADTNP